MAEEQLKVVVVSGDGSTEDEGVRPLPDILARLGQNEVTVLKTGDTAGLQDAFDGSSRILCVVTGYSFQDKSAGLFAAAIENGMRLVVLDMNLHNKHLAERLGITNIKHKVRIEPMDLSDWTEDKERLLEAVLRDELSRLA